MKKLIILLIVTICALSCNHRDKEYVPQSFTSGKWYIADYHKDGKEKQNLYPAFYFTFSKDNYMTVKNDNHIYYGEWSIFKSDVTDDAPVKDIYFKIIFNERDLSELNGDWKIEKKTNDYISLYQVKNEGKNCLILEKSI
ncbi:hypothetical protein ACX0HA_14875 [Flavobacterium hauense]